MKYSLIRIRERTMTCMEKNSHLLEHLGRQVARGSKALRVDSHSLMQRTSSKTFSEEEIHSLTSWMRKMISLEVDSSGDKTKDRKVARITDSKLETRLVEISLAATLSKALEEALVVECKALEEALINMMTSSVALGEVDSEEVVAFSSPPLQCRVEAQAQLL